MIYRYFHRRAAYIVDPHHLVPLNTRDSYNMLPTKFLLIYLQVGDQCIVTYKNQNIQHGPLKKDIWSHPSSPHK